MWACGVFGAGIFFACFGFSDLVPDAWAWYDQGTGTIWPWSVKLNHTILHALFCLKTWETVYFPVTCMRSCFAWFHAIQSSTPLSMCRDFAGSLAMGKRHQSRFPGPFCCPYSGAVTSKQNMRSTWWSIVGRFLCLWWTTHTTSNLSTCGTMKMDLNTQWVHGSHLHHFPV